MWQLARDNIVSAPALSPSNGWLDLPDAPGLGLSLDDAIVDRLTQTF